MSWFEKLLPSRIRTESGSAEKKSIPEGLWRQCPECQSVLYKAELERNNEVCPKCEFHMRIYGRKRLDIFLDKEGREEIGASVGPTDMLKFRDTKKYKDRIVAAQKETDEKDALIVMKGNLYGIPVVAAAFDFRYMGGQWDLWWGSALCGACKRRLKQKQPLFAFQPVGAHVCKKLCSR